MVQPNVPLERHKVHLEHSSGSLTRSRALESTMNSTSTSVQSVAIPGPSQVIATTHNMDPSPSQVTSDEGSLQQGNIESDSEDENDDGRKRNEDELRLTQKVNSIDCIEAMRISPTAESRFSIPLCRLISMPIVRPSLDSDIKRLEAEFTHGYRPGSSVFYVSICDDIGGIRNLTNDEKNRLSPLWRLESDRFDAKLQQNEHLQHLVGRMFFICDGNHRFKAWTGFIERLHSKESAWHISVDCICLNPTGKTGLLLNAMHDINKSTENSHVKTNLVHTLHRIRATGTQSLESFKDILPDWEYKKCLKSPARGKTWYPLTTDVFISFLWRQEIADAADEAARRCVEEAPAFGRSDEEITNAMRTAAKSKTNTYKGQFSKLLAVAHPGLGDDFLDEVTLHWSKNSKPEMTLDKLQLVATSVISASFKVRWLQWWNSGAMTRQAAHFPSKPFTDKEFESWLNKACFWASLEESFAIEFEKIQKEEHLPVEVDSDNLPLSPAQFVECWRVRIWVHGFSSLFRGKEAYSRTKAFNLYTYTPRILKRVLFRYVMFELLPKGAIQRTQLPGFITTWVDKASLDQCMYSTGLLRTWGVLHLNSGCWYVDCGGGFCPAEEETKMKAIDQVEKGLGGSNHPTLGDDQTGVEHDVTVDLSQMNDKDKAKAIAQMQRAAEKAETRKVKEAQKLAQKVEKATLVADVKAKAAEAVAAIKATGKPPKSQQRIESSAIEATQTSSASPSRTLRKRDSSLIDLSVSRLSLGTSPPLFVDDSGSREMDEFIFHGSLHSLLSHRVEHGSFPSGWTELQSFLEKHKADRQRAFKGVISQSRAIDLMILDIPEGLPVPGVSSPLSIVPPWNIIDPQFLKSAFDFASSHLHDDGAILLFHPDAAQLKLDLKGICQAFHFKVFRKWMGVNRLHLTNARDSSKMTLCFGIQLLVRNLPTIPASRFKLQSIPDLALVGIHVDSDDVLHNVVTKDSQLMNGNVPWRGPREKDPGLMQILIESFSLAGDVVFDCSAATGATIHACRRSGRHIVAFEEDALIFNALLQPLILEKESPVQKKQRVTQEVSNSDSEDSEDIDIPQIEASNLFCTSRVTTSPRRSSILQPLWERMIISPTRPFSLPIYAEEMALDFIRAPRTASISHYFRGDPRILQLVDDSANCEEDVANSHATTSCE